MKRLSTLTLLIALAGTVPAPTATMAEDMKMDHGAAMGGGGGTPANAGTPADKAFAASMQTMMKNMDHKPTGNPDRDFVVMMMPHHQGAIDMAKVELQYGKDPMLRTLAADIVKAQEKEIGEMKAWLAKHPR